MTFRKLVEPDELGIERGLRLTLLNPLSPENEVPRWTRLRHGFGGALRKAGARVDSRT